MKQVAILIALTLLASCKNDKKSEQPVSQEAIQHEVALGTSPHPGKKLMETKCYVCHSPTAPEKEGRIGPPMIAIKAHYINEQTTKEEFTEAMWSFVENPSVEKAKLRGAVKRFGVMPYQPFKKEEISQIAEYIFEYQIDEPEWFKEHWENGHKKKRKPYKNDGKKIVESNNLTNEEIGLKYVLNTKKELGKNLMGTIQKKGTLAALEFCNIQAYPLTDSMATIHNAKIKRVSDKPRNLKNQANTKELKHIAYFKNTIASEEGYLPIVESGDGTVQFYSPIITNSTCIQCHGKPMEQVTPETLKALKKLYPDDKALGYGTNEVRGIWVVNFDEE